MTTTNIKSHSDFSLNSLSAARYSHYDVDHCFTGPQARQVLTAAGFVCYGMFSDSNSTRETSESLWQLRVTGRHRAQTRECDSSLFCAFEKSGGGGFLSLSWLCRRGLLWRRRKCVITYRDVKRHDQDAQHNAHVNAERKSANRERNRRRKRLHAIANNNNNNANSLIAIG